MQLLEFIFEIDSQKSIVFCEKIIEILKAIDYSGSYLLDGKKISTAKLISNLKKSNRNGFNIQCDNFKFSTGTIGAYEHILFYIESKDCKARWWEVWVDSFIYLEGFIQAWLVDDEFDYWQNATDPIEYTAKGKPFEGLPMISNGLPPPLDQLEIDTSNNAGLRKLCDGYVEAIGAKMWFSDIFLNKIDKNIENIAINSGAKIEQLADGLYKLSMPTDLFIDDTSIEEQRKLRKALYG